MTQDELSSPPEAVNKIIPWIRSVIGITSCFLAIAFATFGAYIWLPATLHYHITEHYSITAPNHDAIVYLGVLVPKSGPYQRIEDMEVSWHSEQVRETTPRVDAIKLTGPIDTGTTRDAVFEYNAKVSHGFVLWRAEPDSCQLLPQCMIESDHPVIVERVNQITDGASWRDAYKIYSFTDNYLIASGDYKNCTGNMSALEAYQSGSGECGEFSRLMVALCRVSEIPSVVVSGILLPNFGLFASDQTRIGEHPGVAHAWVEFSDDDIWTMADPAWGASTWDIWYFGRNDGRHLSYGCINHEGEVYAKLHRWARRNGSLIRKDFAALKFVASADSKDVSITPVVTVSKVWDGRWFNALVTLIITILLLCYLRSRILKMMYI